LDEGLFKNITMAVGTLRGVLQNVIRNAGITAGEAIENGVERPLSAV